MKFTEVVPLHMTRVATSIVLALAIAGCGSSPMEPIASSTLIGDFGAEHVVLHATSTGAEIDYICMAVTISKPLATDADGHFTAILMRAFASGRLACVEAPAKGRHSFGQRS